MASGRWSLFEDPCGPYILEAAPSAAYAAMFVCSTLFGAIDASEEFSGIGMRHLVQYLNEHSKVRTLVLQQCRVMQADYTSRVLPAVYFGSTDDSIDECVARGIYLHKLPKLAKEVAPEAL